MAGKSNPDFLNGVPELLILRLLERQPMHGYELVQSLRLVSAEALQFGEGSVYPVLHKMVRNQLLSSQREVVNGRQRVIYHITSAGIRKMHSSIAAWHDIVAAVHQVLEGTTHGSAAPAA